MSIVLFKTASGALAPANQQSFDALGKIKIGDAIQVSIKKVNNLEFHKKLFALFNFAYDHWDPQELEYKGQKVQKNFDQFRKDCTILAGFYDTVVNLRGDIRLVAKSLSFDKMNHDEREKLYSAIINVILQKILVNYTHEELENIINQLLEFE